MGWLAQLRSLAIALLAVVAVSSDASALFPDRTIVLKLGFSAGGSSDISARAFIGILRKYLPDGSTVIVDYKPGSDGIIMYRELAATKPDGYTLGLLVTPNALSVLHERNDLRYNMESFEYLGQLMADYATLTVGKNSRFKTLNEMLEWGRKNPQMLNVGVTGLSGVYIPIREMFAKAGVEVTFVPYKGGGELSAAVLGGHIHASGVNLTSATAYKDAQRVLTVFSEQRLLGMEDTPTVRESGVDIVAVTNRGIIAPRGLPDDVRKVLVEAIGKAAQDPEYHALLAKDSLSPAYLALKDYEAYARTVYNQYGDIWKRSPWIER